MPNEEMMRPCTLPAHWEQTEPFDACDFNMDYFEVFRNESDCNYNVYFLGTKIATVDEYADSFPIYRQIITTIADALNARVLATKKVLAGLPKDAKVYTFDEKTGDALRCTFDDEFGWVCRTGHFGEALKLGRPYKIFAINDPKTAEYLRQFKREGVRRVGNV
jgi:hypothetical protein